MGVLKTVKPAYGASIGRFFVSCIGQAPSDEGAFGAVQTWTAEDIRSKRIEGNPWTIRQISNLLFAITHYAMYCIKEENPNP